MSYLQTYISEFDTDTTGKNNKFEIPRYNSLDCIQNHSIANPNTIIELKIGERF